VVTSDDFDTGAVQDIDRPDIKRNFALLFFKMKSEYCLADSTIQVIIDDFAQTFAVSSAYANRDIRLC